VVRPFVPSSVSPAGLVVKCQVGSSLGFLAA